ncbi:methyltransferase domain-containing protein [Microbacterium dextranolyticum]|uniref:Methyltransferase domain-containing protein n=1 Tax=Microbacterium dextranolyticum TaxID=36806 RepID=A0A9W6M4A4_9MICO|nr:methyltransferase domain-containing protein [Microbacterium dextranolyticum]MBM7461838.1 2-polyprenyl-3-methyl-5-hydroxy-6-metoxy-1,4-benzoquinol methylase [Microbacterium dextranolyticum]GLJ94079.1 hypothetical protein GCM10017591_01400 [Microbacterium dextranolyticum]
MSAGLGRRDADLRELMDDPQCDPARLRRTLQRFDIVNRLVSGWGDVYRRHVRPLARERGGRLTVLDIGCGGGDVLRRLSAAAARDGISLEGVGIDPDARALEVARRRPVDGVTFRQAHSADLVAEGERGGRQFDVVISNHLLHHLDDAQLRGLLADSASLSTALVVHSDISRSRLAYAAYAAGITPLAPGSFLRTDGLRSIRRSWTPGELAARLPEGWTVEHGGRFRLLVTRRSPA